MNLTIQLPFAVFARRTELTRLVVETSEGSLGLLPHRLDCVAMLRPGLLVYQAEAEDEAYFAIDEGVLVKTGSDVVISTRRALRGASLPALREAVQREFLALDESERAARAVMAKLETRLLQRLTRLRR